ncbi:Calcium-binding EF-hand family protein [Rhynchospora pubera]|uniref:Calcium-binding EF-hand family protein n=1 Tax=Rhynchospora pubera TaxID=906938 RepID=A0AAV8G1Q7_9POAL|nr:Calcium-binding EF-hand family protein [Rhynchospora pubera]
MSVELLNGTTILSFIEDEMAFNTLNDSRFASLDSDSDGKLTIYAEMAKELMSLRFLGSYFGAMDEQSLSHDESAQLYQGLFEQFDKDGDGMVDPKEFRIGMKEVMLAVAHGLGFVPIQNGVVDFYYQAPVAVAQRLARQWQWSGYQSRQWRWRGSTSSLSFFISPEKSWWTKSDHKMSLRTLHGKKSTDIWSNAVVEGWTAE